MHSVNSLIRAANFADLDAIFQIQYRAYGALEARTKEMLYDLLTGHTRFANLRCKILEVGGQVVGYLVVEYLDHIMLGDLVIAEEYRGRGLGAALLRSSFESGRVHLLAVKVSNTRAQALYERLGFAVIHRLEKYYKDGTDAHIMKLVPE